MLMSDIDGLYTEDPRKNPDAKLIHEVENLTEEMMEAPEAQAPPREPAACARS